MVLPMGLKIFFLKYENIKIIYHSAYRGKGASIRTSIKYITGNVVIFQDANLEYELENYVKLIKPIKN